MKIGYSFWGFLSNGITETPDGGRSHRRALIDGLINRGHDIVFLQPDRDALEAHEDLSHRYVWDAGLPTVDALFLEWRWAIPGRNTTWCGAAGHTCDLHRQTELVDQYTERLGVPTIVWDKDRRLDADDPLRAHPAITVCEPAMHPTAGSVSLLFPVADDALTSADPVALAATPRPMALAYVGNQYDRDDQFSRYFAPAAAELPHVVAGKWTDTSRWPKLNFIGRVPYPKVAKIHRRASATVLLLPERYERVGHVTQRIFEAVLEGCLPITPLTLRSADLFVPPELLAADGTQVTDLAGWVASIAGTPMHAALIQAAIEKLSIFRLTRQLDVIDTILRSRVTSAT